MLRGTWGVYHQPIDLMTIPVIGIAERAAHYVIGGEYVAGGNFRIRAEGYYKKLENLTEQIRDQDRNAQILAPADSGNVRGFDFFVSGALSDQLTASLGYAFSIAKAREDILSTG